MAFNVTDTRQINRDKASQTPLERYPELQWMREDKLVVLPNKLNSIGAILVKEKRENIGIVIQSADDKYPRGTEVMFHSTCLSRPDFVFDGDCIFVPTVDVIAITKSEV